MAESLTAAEEQVVLILVGLIGSGKSTFAQALERHFPNFRRCNQDDLGNRKAVEYLARTSLGNGLSVCIDRTNFDAQQRAYWVRIAREFPGTAVWVLVFDTPREVCETRLKRRTSHPTILDFEQAQAILSRFASDYMAPTSGEGYDRILYLPTKDQLTVYNPSDIQLIFEKIRQVPIPGQFSQLRASITCGALMGAAILLTAIIARYRGIRQ